MTPELRNEIIRELKKVRAPAKAARTLGLDIRVILPIADELSVTPRLVREETYGGLGRPELREFAVARKRASETWNNTKPEIAAARAAYEKGTHEMATGRDGDWLILYSIPRRKPAPRPDYFRPET